MRLIHRLLSLLLTISLMLPICVFAEEATKTYGTPYFTIRLPEQNLTALDIDGIKEYFRTLLGESTSPDCVFFSHDPARELYWFATANAASADKIILDLTLSDVSRTFSLLRSEIENSFPIERWKTTHVEHNSGILLRANVTYKRKDTSVFQVIFFYTLQKSGSFYDVKLICQAYEPLSKETLDYIDDVLLNRTFFPAKLPNIVSETEYAEQHAQFNRDKRAEQVRQAEQTQKSTQPTERPSSVVQADSAQQNSSNLLLFVLLFVIALIPVLILFAMLLKKSKKPHPALNRVYVVFACALPYAIVTTCINTFSNVRIGAIPTVAIGIIFLIPSRFLLRWLERRTHESSNCGNRVSSAAQPPPLVAEINHGDSTEQIKTDSGLAENFDELEAEKKGLTVEQLYLVRQLERENEEFRRNEAQHQIEKWKKESYETKLVYPKFSFISEQNDPDTGERFMDMVRKGISVKTAYEVIHIKELANTIVDNQKKED